jgi:hypothetical protein
LYFQGLKEGRGPTKMTQALERRISNGKGFFNSRMNLIWVKKESFGLESNPKALSIQGSIFSDLITAISMS